MFQSWKDTLQNPRFFLHIGHGKTGTSAIQSAFALAKEDLLNHNIEYPIEQSEQDKAAQFGITSGNWQHNPGESLADELKRLARVRTNNHSILLSSESLFWHLETLFNAGIETLNELNLHVILAVREVEEMLSSEYQQRVKRHGEKRPFEQFLKSRHFISSHHKKAAEVIMLLNKHQIKTTIINYSKHKHNITELIFNTLSATSAYPRDSMQGVVVNRSLSQKELTILTIINSLFYTKFPWISARLSDALAKQLPGIESQKCRLSEAKKQKLYEVNNDFIKVINQNLPEDDHLVGLSTMTKENSPVNRDLIQKIRREEQLSIDMIGATLLTSIQNDCLQKRLSNKTVDQLIKLSQESDIDPETRLELLELAASNRPQGKKLIKLVAEARKQISNH